jgi:transposase
LFNEDVSMWYIDDELKEKMLNLYNSLSEKDRRRYAAIEAEKLGHGGISFIATLFNCDEKTINKGKKELNDHTCMEHASTRLPGGGRKSKLESIKDIDAVFLEVLKEYTAGDPMRAEIKWTNLARSRIREEMTKNGIEVSRNIVSKLLKKHGFSKRKAQKSKSTGEHKDRDAQFNKIKKVKEEYENSENPIISVDTKKKNS